MGHIGRLTSVLFFMLLFEPALCWDVDDLELFDLVEEVNLNFYDVLEVPKTATSSEIKKAYRKKTLVLHPDKNEAEDAEEKFRQLVAVYEVLKDEEKREKYNLVLENGLPDWRQPVYYYRKARKLGLLELAIVLCMVITIGQYFVLWAVYLERRLALEDFFMSKKKREKKGKRRAAAINDQIEEDMQETLDSIPKPRPRDLWPMTFSIWIFRFAISLPAKIRERQENRKQEEEERRRQQQELEEQAKREMELKKEQELRKQKRKQKVENEVLPQLVPGSAPVVYGMDNQTHEAAEEEDYKQVLKEGDWTDEDYVMLSKAYIKFPGGTTNRWEKIAEMVGRPVNEVTVKCKKMKGTYQMNLSSTVQAGTKTSKKNVGISDQIISTKDGDVTGPVLNSNETEATIRKRHKHKAGKDTERTLMISKSSENAEEPGLEINTDSSVGLKSDLRAVETSANTKKSSESQNGINSLGKGAKGSNNKTVIKGTTDSAVPKSESENKKEAVNAEGNTEDPENWSQNQQVILEWALRQYPKGTEQRWEKVAEHIPGKTKEDCIARFKHLAELVKQKKKQS